MAVSENRKEIPPWLSPFGPELTDAERQTDRLDAYLATTQGISDLLPGRIRDLRERRVWSERQLAKEMTEVGVPLTGDKVSKIERGRRRVTVEEFLAFAYVLDVPLSRLMSPREGELQVRAGGIALDRSEIGNWMVWGPPWSELARNSTHALRLARRIATTVQILDEERDPDEREKSRRELLAAITDLRKTLRIRPGVLRRRQAQAASDEVLQRDDPRDGETR